MRIAEIYKSIQGEGSLTGVPSVFVRTSGCNLRCWFCDTPHTSWRPEGRDLPVDAIVAAVEQWDIAHVVVTGGEPMLYAELIPLSRALRELRRHVTIETAGTLALPVECDLMSISPKLAASAPSGETHPRWRRRHLRDCYRPDVIASLLAEYEYQLKFVVDQIDDVEATADYLCQFPQVDPYRVWLMPQGRTAAEVAQREDWASQEARRRGWNYCARKQLEWFGAARCT